MKRTLVVALLLFTCTCVGQNTSAPHHLFFHVTLSPQITKPQSGRLLIFMRPGTKTEDLGPGFVPGETWIAAKEVDALTPGESVDVDADDIAYPHGFSQAKAGDYVVGALLDVTHHYNYDPGAPSVRSAPVVENHFDPGTASSVPLTLSLVTSARNSDTNGMNAFQFESPSLTAFWGRPTTINGYVVLPPSYSSTTATYPTMYWTHGFGGSFAGIAGQARRFKEMMDQKQIPEMIFVVLDESCPQGTHEFADSVNNGPWGHALTAELIPHLEQTYRMDAKVNGRFLNGHSSGGWATLWLQVAYPKVFGGTWSTSPDPSDYHSFTGPDLYAPHANAYHKTDGTPWMLVRDQGKDIASLEDFARQETVIGPYGGQMTSFEWVFSPKSPSGAPMPLFDRATGEVDPQVVKYWGEHYDIANKVEREWTQIGPDLRGKIHVIVGTADTFHLDEPARLLETRLKKLNAGATFTYLPGRTHFDLYSEGDDRNALMKKIVAEAYAVARPK